MCDYDFLKSSFDSFERVSSLRSSRKEPTFYLHETDPTYYDGYDREFIIEDKKEETLEDEKSETILTTASLIL